MGTVGVGGVDGVSGGDEEGGRGGDRDAAAPSSPAEHPHLPGYATAVATASPEEQEDAAIVPGSGSGDGEGGGGLELSPTTTDDCEASGFYAAVDPGAVSKLVGWGISCDFARVALRRTRNDIPGALRLVAEGSMDAHLAKDQEEMAQEAEAEAEAEAAAAAAPGPAAESAPAVAAAAVPVSDGNSPAQ
ncbi:unnamed protein product [Laminaria digitata]